jgi:drug/metabolite transporter (DMT)-like permease
MNNKLSKPAFVWLIAGLCCLLWGSAFPSIKTGYRLLGIESGDTPTIILFAGVRFFFAGVLTLIIFSLAGKRVLLPKRSSLKKIAILSIFQTVIQYLFFYLGLAYTSGERGSVINASSVFFALIISALMFKMEKLSIRKIIGCIIGFTGVILVSLDAFSARGTGLKGDLFILISSISYAFSSVFMKRYSKEDSPAMLSGWQFMLGGAVLSITGFALGGRLSGFTPASAALLGYLALLSAVAYSLWSILLKYNPVSRVAVCGFMIPVFGYALSSLFAPAAEKGSALIMLCALALTAVGIVTVNYSKEKNI